MKKILLLMAALCLSSLSFAQIMVATLQHGDSIRVFYNTNAFVDAYNAATTGDVISLSAGGFISPEINKDSLTIRGAGMDKTFITTNTYLGRSNSNNIHSITIEGVQFNSQVQVSCNLIVKCYNVYYDNYYGSSNISISGQFVNCVFDYYSTNSSSRPDLINCIVGSLGNSNSNFINCVVLSNEFSNQTHGIFINTILVSKNNNGNYFGLPSTAFTQNCIGVNAGTYTGNIFSASCNQNSRMANRSIFANFNLDALDPERYVLTDSAQAVYLGSDSTQIGLYGGFMPYSNSSTYPVISRLNVAHQTTADGHLSVDIQVGYRQESEDNE